MKKITTREFFHSSGLAKYLQPGEKVVVTSNGKPEMIVRKAGKRPRKTAAQLRAEALALLDKPRTKKIDTVKFLRELRK